MIKTMFGGAACAVAAVARLNTQQNRNILLSIDGFHLYQLVYFVVPAHRNSATLSDPALIIALSIALFNRRVAHGTPFFVRTVTDVH